MSWNNFEGGSSKILVWQIVRNSSVCLPSQNCKHFRFLSQRRERNRSPWRNKLESSHADAAKPYNCLDSSTGYKKWRIKWLRDKWDFCAASTFVSDVIFLSSFAPLRLRYFSFLSLWNKSTNSQIFKSLKKYKFEDGLFQFSSFQLVSRNGPFVVCRKCGCSPNVGCALREGPLRHKCEQEEVRCHCTRVGGRTSLRYGYWYVFGFRHLNQVFFRHLAFL